MPDPKDDASDSKDKDSAAYLKRREQVRRAQRTHRERKENYIKSLENEVLQLRTNEAKILQENRTLQQEVGRLRQLLDQNGIPHTVGTDDFLPTATLYSSRPESTSSISVFSNPNHHQQLHIGTDTNFYLTESEESQLSASSSALKQKRSFFRRRGRSESESNDGSSGVGPSEADIATVAQSAANMNLRDMNQTDLGMEFVLTLEAPCLHHTQGDPNNPYAPSGHALTASAPLLYQSPEQPVDTHTEATPFGVHHHQWEAPQLSLEKLLELSSSFDLTDELTPVQAWNQIRSHPDFENLEVGTLRGLTQDILKEVKCYGFGAVIDEGIFLDLLAKTFPGVQFTGLAV